MPNPTVRLSPDAYSALKQLAETSGDSMQDILGRAIEAYRREVFMQEANASYAALRHDPQAWADWQAELRAWDATLLDGL